MPLRASALRVGHSHEQVVVEDLTRTQIVMYAGASGDFHPIHSDERFARATGLPGVFGHGMLTMALSGRALTDFVGDGRLTHFAARFVAQVWPGSTLTTTVTVREVRQDGDQWLADLDLVTLDQDGEKVLDGSATARLDP